MSADIKSQLKTIPGESRNYRLLCRSESNNIHSEYSMNKLKQLNIFPFTKGKKCIFNETFFYYPELAIFITKEVAESLGHFSHRVLGNRNFTLEDIINIFKLRNESYFTYISNIHVNAYKHVSYKQIYDIVNNSIQDHTPTIVITNIHIFQTRPISKQEKEYFNKLKSLNNYKYKIILNKNVSGDMFKAYNTILTFIKN